MFTKPSVLSIALLNAIACTDVLSLSMRDHTFSHVSCGAWTRDVKSSPIHNPFDSCEWFSCYDCSDHMVCSSHQDLVRASYVCAVHVLLKDVHTRHMAHVCYKGALQQSKVTTQREKLSDIKVLLVSWLHVTLLQKVARVMSSFAASLRSAHRHVLSHCAQRWARHIKSRERSAPASSQMRSRRARALLVRVTGGGGERC